jgi:uncharacterized membrane protein YfcA
MAFVTHRRSGYVDYPLVWRVGPPLALGGFVGALLSGTLPDSVLRLSFGVLAAAALVVSAVGAGLQRRLLLEAEGRSVGDLSTGQRSALSAAAGITGVLSGLVGAGGGFIITPLLISIVRIPAKAVVGSMSLIGALVIAGNVAGRGSQLLEIDPWIAVLVLGGGAAGGTLGARAVRVLSPRTIRFLVFLLIGANAVRSLTLAIVDLVRS